MAQLDRVLHINSYDFDNIAHEVQGNILGSHRRRHADHVFVRFDQRNIVQAIGAIIDRGITTVARQKPDHHAGRDFIGFALSAAGYAVLALEPPAGVAFRAGMQRRGEALRDPSPNEWDVAFAERPWHGLITLATDERESLTLSTGLLVSELVDAGIATSDIHVESGEALPCATEPFGFRDGISTPKLLDTRTVIPATRWNPYFDLGQAFVVDPHGSHGSSSLGSFVVFRKLRQSVDEFRRVCRPESLVGRRRDGTPLVASDDGDNDFAFEADDQAQCPVTAHIRKANPRDRASRSTQFVRRGMPYVDGDDRGLLFIGYNSDLEAQFETMQGHWFESGFPETDTGPDEMMGDYVQMTGGEYFFTPSISTIYKLAGRQEPRRDHHDDHYSGATMTFQIQDIPEDKEFGQGPITPDGFAGRLFELLLTDDDAVEAYVRYASIASTQSAADGHASVVLFLDGVDPDLKAAIDRLPYPARGHLLEALRVMGIRFRRFGALDVEGFRTFISSMAQSDMNITW